MTKDFFTKLKNAWTFRNVRAGKVAEKEFIKALEAKLRNNGEVAFPLTLSIDLYNFIGESKFTELCDKAGYEFQLDTHVVNLTVR